LFDQPIRMAVADAPSPWQLVMQLFGRMWRAVAVQRTRIASDAI
jgi:hypothetical protein